MNLLNNRWLPCLMAIFSTIVCTYISIRNFENSFVFILLLCLSSYLLFNSYLELIVALTFIAPNNRKKSLEGKNWNNGTLQYEGPDVYYVSSMGEKKHPWRLLFMAGEVVLPQCSVGLNYISQRDSMY